MEFQNEEGSVFLRKKILRIVGIVVVALILWIIQPVSYENIDAGNVGIKINLYGTDRGVDNITIVTGRVWYNTWTTKIIEFPWRLTRWRPTPAGKCR